MAVDQAQIAATPWDPTRVRLLNAACRRSPLRRRRADILRCPSKCRAGAHQSTASDSPCQSSALLWRPGFSTVGRSQQGLDLRSRINAALCSPAPPLLWVANQTAKPKPRNQNPAPTALQVRFPVLYLQILQECADFSTFDMISQIRDHSLKA